jgi:hypothetical protein
MNDTITIPTTISFAYLLVTPEIILIASLFPNPPLLAPSSSSSYSSSIPFNSSVFLSSDCEAESISSLAEQQVKDIIDTPETNKEIHLILYSYKKFF